MTAFILPPFQFWAELHAYFPFLHLSPQRGIFYRKPPHQQLRIGQRVTFDVVAQGNGSAEAINVQVDQSTLAPGTADNAPAAFGVGEPLTSTLLPQVDHQPWDNMTENRRKTLKSAAKFWWLSLPYEERLTFPREALLTRLTQKLYIGAAAEKLLDWLLLHHPPDAPSAMPPGIDEVGAATWARAASGHPSSASTSASVPCPPPASSTSGAFVPLPDFLPAEQQLAMAARAEQWWMTRIQKRKSRPGNAQGWINILLHEFLPKEVRNPAEAEWRPFLAHLYTHLATLMPPRPFLHPVIDAARQAKHEQAQARREAKKAAQKPKGRLPKRRRDGLPVTVVAESDGVNFPPEGADEYPDEVEGNFCEHEDPFPAPFYAPQPDFVVNFCRHCGENLQGLLACNYCPGCGNPIA